MADKVKPGMITTDYSFTNSHANIISSLVVCDKEIRLLLLGEFISENGDSALIDLFSEFVGMANSVVKNCHNVANDEAIMRGVVHPDSSSRLNLPTLLGATYGVKLANSKPSENMCKGCAFRLGTPANQSESTVCDAQYTKVNPSNNFMCHESLGNRKKCIGHKTSNMQ